jgi:HD domain
LADACVSLARTTESAAIFDHSIRSFLYARLLAEREGSLADAAYDEGLLFAACILHDLGLGTGAPGKARFEVEGADLAAALLSERGVAARDIDRVWEAIAPHSSLGIAERRGLLAYLTQTGVFIDVGHETHIPLGRLQVVRNSIRDLPTTDRSGMRSSSTLPGQMPRHLPTRSAPNFSARGGPRGELHLGALEQRRSQKPAPAPGVHVGQAAVRTNNLKPPSPVAGLRQDIAHHQSIQRSFSTTSALVARINAATQSLTAILSITAFLSQLPNSGRIGESVSA